VARTFQRHVSHRFPLSPTAPCILQNPTYTHLRAPSISLPRGPSPCPPTPLPLSPNTMPTPYMAGSPIPATGAFPGRPTTARPSPSRPCRVGFPLACSPKENPCSRRTLPPPNQRCRVAKLHRLHHSRLGASRTHTHRIIHSWRNDTVSDDLVDDQHLPTRPPGSGSRRWDGAAGATRVRVS